MQDLFKKESGFIRMEEESNEVFAAVQLSHNGNGAHNSYNNIKSGAIERNGVPSERYKILVEHSLDMIYILDKKGDMIYYSPSSESILGYPEGALLGKSIFDFIHPDDHQEITNAFYKGLLNPGKKITIEFRFLKFDDSYVYLESSGVNLLEDPSVKGIIVNSRDITNRKLAGIENQMLKTAVEQSYESVVITDTDGNIQYVNEKFEEVTGYKKEEVIGRNSNVLKSGFTSDEEYKDLWKTITSGKVWEGEFKNKNKNGTYYWESARITPVKNEQGKIINYIAIKDDISIQKKREEELIKTLDEKEIMLREIHHRVKNNLQIVSSLLKLQSDSASDPELKAHLRVSRNRIKSMALIHQQLFNSPDLRHIDIDEYLYSLSGQVYSTFNETPEKIGYKADANGVTFNVETAIPFGLIVSELISNSLKYAFVKRSKGLIKIDVFKTPINTYKLIYKDDGVGIPCEYINGSSESSGIYLIKTLVNQLSGNIRIYNDLGTTYEIEFSGIYPKLQKNNTHKENNSGKSAGRQPSFIPFSKMI